ncbi:MAG: hypothetical protein EXS39_02825 [Opitutaceae bacterium]|nr:hypothetical protein [Opitutaceae bacterium]
MKTEAGGGRPEAKGPGTEGISPFVAPSPTSDLPPPASRLRSLASVWRRAALALVITGLFLTSGCVGFHREAPRPGRTTLNSPLVVLPAQSLGNYLIVEAKWDRSRPYHFLIDTGSSVTLVSPEIAKRYAAKNAPASAAPEVHVKSAEGNAVVLPSTTLRRLELGDARFENVPVLVYDCTPLSAHLGVKIDAILGFPLFRETQLTLDYPHSRVRLNSAYAAPLQPGTTIPFNNASRTPLIPIRLGDATFIALIDSGSDAPLSLNPVGLQLAYAMAPRPGATVSTLTGDRTQQVGRLAGTLVIGNYDLPRPVVEITDELSAIGGAVLRNFIVTFNQEKNQVTFYRETPEPIAFGPFRSSGLSFSKAPAYWRVAGVVANSSAAAARVQPGDLVTRINGEPVAQWDFRRYEQLVAAAPSIIFTFLNGSRENDLTLPVFELVP